MAANITNKKTREVIRFKIDHIDPLGQGVFKQEDQIYFIPKTLPGEEGSARIIKTRKGVNFTEPPFELTTQSPDRITPKCMSFQQCSGCQYLHTEYATELRFKEAALRKHLQRVCSDEQRIQMIFEEDRFGYRNRVQLHYDKKKNQIGYISTFSNQILDRPSCLLPQDVLSQRISEIYNMDIQHFPVAKDQGHIEILFRENKIVETFNQASD